MRKAHSMSNHNIQPSSSDTRDGFTFDAGAVWCDAAAVHLEGAPLKTSGTISSTSCTVGGATLDAHTQGWDVIGNFAAWVAPYSEFVPEGTPAIVIGSADHPTTALVLSSPATTMNWELSMEGARINLSNTYMRRGAGDAGEEWTTKSGAGNTYPIALTEGGVAVHMTTNGFALPVVGRALDMSNGDTFEKAFTLTNAARASVVAPATGLVVHDGTDMYVYNGTEWVIHV